MNTNAASWKFKAIKINKSMTDSFERLQAARKHEAAQLAIASLWMTPGAAPHPCLIAAPPPPLSF
jgi:hypothetical protein